jgi:hypothetical protein
MIAIRTSRLNTIRLVVTLLLLAPGLVVAANPASQAAATTGRNAVSHHAHAANPFDCVVEMRSAQPHCHQCIRTPFTPLAEKIQDGDEVPLLAESSLYPAARATKADTPSPGRSPVARQPTFIMFGNFRS